MMMPTDKETQVFQSLAQSGEGEVLKGYLARLERHLADDLIDNTNPTPADIAGARLMRQFIKELQDRLMARATITSEFERLD